MTVLPQGAGNLHDPARRGTGSHALASQAPDPGKAGRGNEKALKAIKSDLINASRA